MKIFAIRLKELREEQKISQRNLAVRLNSTQRTVCNWETDISEPSMEMLQKIALFFGVTSDYLIGLEDETGAKVTIKNYDQRQNKGIINNN